MPIVGGLDIHRRQITFDYVDLRGGDSQRGVIRPATREAFREWLGQFGRKRCEFALEGTTGWRFVVEELEHAGMRAHLAEPAETRARRGPKRRAKTDRADARLLRDLLLAGNLPESWIPPSHLADLRSTVRLRKTLVAARDGWRRRIAAMLFHHGLPEGPSVMTFAGRLYAEKAELPAAGRQVIDVALRMIDTLDAEVDALNAYEDRRQHPADTVDGLDRLVTGIVLQLGVNPGIQGVDLAVEVDDQIPQRLDPIRIRIGQLQGVQLGGAARSPHVHARWQHPVLGHHRVHLRLAARAITHQVEPVADL